MPSAKNPKVLFLFPPPTDPKRSLCLDTVPQSAAEPAAPPRHWCTGIVGAFVKTAADALGQGGWAPAKGGRLGKGCGLGLCCRPVWP